MRKVELLKTVKGSRVWGKGEKVSEPFPPDLQQEIALLGTVRDRGTVRIIEEPDPIIVSSEPIELREPIIKETLDVVSEEKPEVKSKIKLKLKKSKK